MYVITYHYYDKVTWKEITEVISKKKLSSAWKAYLASGDNHDLARYTPRTIINIENTEEK